LLVAVAVLESDQINLKLTASDQLNPDLNGRPSPIVVRLFELKHPVTFENADFFSLYERAKESLATRTWWPAKNSNCARVKPWN
jgi:type VI secretion system VasD/TssJ family lipoprotein